MLGEQSFAGEQQQQVGLQCSSESGSRFVVESEGPGCLFQVEPLADVTVDETVDDEVVPQMRVDAESGASRQPPICSLGMRRRRGSFALERASVCYRRPPSGPTMLRSNGGSSEGSRGGTGGGGLGGAMTWAARRRRVRVVAIRVGFGGHGARGHTAMFTPMTPLCGGPQWLPSNPTTQWGRCPRFSR